MCARDMVRVTGSLDGTGHIHTYMIYLIKQVSRQVAAKADVDLENIKTRILGQT